MTDASTTGDEFAQPGVNYPDRRDGEATPGGSDATREPSTDELDRPSTEKEPGEEPTAPEAPGDEPSHQAVGVGVVPTGTQDEAAMDVDVASDDDKVAGIVAQTRQDVGGESAERIADVLTQRFADAGISVDDARLQELSRGVAAG